MSLISEKIIPDLCPVLCDSSNSEAQRHAAGTLRNLAVGDHHRVNFIIEGRFKQKSLPLIIKDSFIFLIV